MFKQINDKFKWQNKEIEFLAIKLKTQATVLAKELDIQM